MSMQLGLWAEALRNMLVAGRLACCGGFRCVKVQRDSSWKVFWRKLHWGSSWHGQVALNWIRLLCKADCTRRCYVRSGGLEEVGKTGAHCAM